MVRVYKKLLAFFKRKKEKNNEYLSELTFLKSDEEKFALDLIKFDLFEPPFDLLDKIMLKISEKEKILIRNRLIFSSFFLIISILMFVPVFDVFYKSISQSSFFQIFSLFFSDFWLVILNWRDVFLAILENLPAMSFAIFFLNIFIFLWSFRKILQLTSSYIHFNHNY